MNTTPNPRNLEEEISKGLHNAALKELKKRKESNEPIIVSKNGKIVKISPENIKIIPYQENK